MIQGSCFGNRLRFTSFGESHGVAVGGVLDGFPSRVFIDLDFIQQALDKRMPCLEIGSGRQEKDKIHLLSGVFESFSLGTPIAFVIENTDAHSQDYEILKKWYRIGHADKVYMQKYGIRDHRGGGRASARETAARVAAGAFVSLYLKSLHIQTHAYTSAIGEHSISKEYSQLSLQEIYTSRLRCPDKEAEAGMEKAWQNASLRGESLGGCVDGLIQNIPAGLGEPVFEKLEAALGAAMLSIPACNGFSFSQGIRGGISTGEDIHFKAYFRPISTQAKATLCESVDNPNLQQAFALGGRHDICCVPRAVPIVEAMTNLVIANFLKTA